MANPPDAGTTSARPQLLVLLAGAGRMAWQFVGIALALWILGQVYVQLTEVWLAVFVSLVVAAILVPASAWLESLGLGRTVSTAIALLVLVVTIGAAGAGMIVRVVDQAPGLADDVRAARGPLLDWLEEGPLQLSREEVAAVLQRSVEDLTRGSGSSEEEAEDAGDAAVDAVVGEEATPADTPTDADSEPEEPAEEEELPDDQRGPSPTVAVRLIRESTVLASAAGAVLLGFVLSFFLVRDRDTITSGAIRHLVGSDHDEIAYRVVRRGWRALYGYVRASLLVGAVDAALIGLVLFVVGVPLAGVLTLLTFLAAFVPVVGALSVGLVSVAVAFVAGGIGDALVVAGAVVVVQQLDAHVLQPVLMRIGTGLHPAATILALTVGGVLGGVLGALLAVPITAVLVAVAAELVDAGVTRTAASTD